MKGQRVGVLAKKVGMTRLFKEDGLVIPVTLLKLESCRVTACKRGGDYISLQVGAGACRKPNRPMRVFFEKNNLEPCAKLCEFRVSEEGILPIGSIIKPSHFFVGGVVDVSGITIGRGFAGGMKRHNFGGLRASHGVSVSHRSHGSTGNRKDPGRVFKNKKMAGHMGCERVTVQNLRVEEVLDAEGLLVVRGSVPGYDGSWVTVRDAVKVALTEQHIFPGMFDMLSGETSQESVLDSLQVS